MTTAEDTGRWVHRFHPSPPDRVELLCLPHAGGSASYFHRFSQGLSPAIQVTAVQYPGQQERRHEPPVTDLVELARRIHETLRQRPEYGRRDLMLLGHSLGAGLAFEIARLLERDGFPARALIVSGRRAPSRYRDERLHEAEDDVLVRDLLRLDGTAGSLLGDPETRALILPVLRADYTAAETYRYRPGPPLTTPITALTGLSDPKVSVDEARSWAEHTTGCFDLRTYPGGHFYLAQHHQAVLAVITNLLAP